MAPPRISKAPSSKKRKTKERASSTVSDYDDHKFRSLFYRNQFHGWVRERTMIPEVGFQLRRDEQREIKMESSRRGWS
ncbi:hypothetical protein AHAS_Ahas04G0097200 [Arachis hypogaea]